MRHQVRITSVGQGWTKAGSYLLGCSPYRLWRWACKFPNLLFNVWVTVAFQPCNFCFLRIPKAFWWLQELAVWLRKPSQEQTMHLPWIGRGGVWTLLLREILQTGLQGILEIFGLEEGILAPENGFPAHMFFPSCGEVFDFALAFHAVEVVHHKGGLLWNCQLDVGDPFGPPSAAPWLLFAIERSAPAVTMQVLQFMLSKLSRNRIVKPKVLWPLGQKHHSCTDVVLSAASHQVVPGCGVLPRPRAHGLSLWEHVALEDDGVFMGGVDSCVQRPLGWDQDQLHISQGENLAKRRGKARHRPEPIQPSLPNFHPPSPSTHWRHRSTWAWPPGPREQPTGDRCRFGRRLRSWPPCSTWKPTECSRSSWSRSEISSRHILLLHWLPPPDIAAARGGQPGPSPAAPRQCRLLQRHWVHQLRSRRRRREPAARQQGRCPGAPPLNWTKPLCRRSSLRGRSTCRERWRSSSTFASWAQLGSLGPLISSRALSAASFAEGFPSQLPLLPSGRAL